MKLTKTKIILLILSLAGFFDSAYLTILHYKNIIPPCTLAKGCETVLTSQFSAILGMPVALLGSIFFFILTILLLLGFTNYFKLLILAGVAVSIIFFSIQAFILRAFCQYCLLSEAIILAIFALSFFLNEKLGKQGKNILQRTRKQFFRQSWKIN